VSDETTHGDPSEAASSQLDDSHDDSHDATSDNSHDDLPDDSQLDAARDVLQDARKRLTEVPAEVVVANHVMGLYELAAIHLGAAPPNLHEAALAIDAVGCLVEGLGDRIGPDAATLRDALANIRLAFVQIKNAAG
jgi:hypothetical protein